MRIPFKSRRPAAAVVLALAAVGGGTAALAAGVPDTITATAKATPGGSKKKPKAVAAAFTMTVQGPGGTRGYTPTSLKWAWSGITSNGGAFPTCTVEMIDSAQSDAACPAKSLVATGKTAAALGTEGNKASSIPCNLSVRVYNAGAGKSTLFLTGSPSDCAGLSYLPPAELTSKRSGATETVTYVIPDNVAHPLPGLEGAIGEFTLNYKKLKVKKNGKAISYLQSTGCKTKKRGFTFTQTYPGGSFDDAVAQVGAGAC